MAAKRSSMVAVTGLRRIIAKQIFVGFSSSVVSLLTYVYYTQGRTYRNCLWERET
jgi:hypothetical protein